MANKDCKICCDHLGNIYKSLKEMCNNHNIRTDTFKNRLKRGWTLEEALTEKKKTILKPTDKFSCMDRLGNTYTSQKDMAKHYKISRYTLQDRLNRGWKLKEALTLPIGTVLITKEKKCKDHLGVSYKSITDMLNTYNISQSAYNSRLKNGWGLEKTLTTPIYSYFKKCKDHLGNGYNSLKDMISYWGIAESTYNKRIKQGRTLEETLTGEIFDIEDHLGNKFKTINDMCKYWNISRATYKDRRYTQGMNMKDSLEIPRDQNYSGGKVSCVDPFGREFDSTANMCRYWGIKNYLYYKRKRYNYSYKEALGLKGRGLRKRVGTKFHNIEFIKYLYKGRNDIDYYLCKVDGVEKILNENSWYTYIRR